MEQTYTHSVDLSPFDQTIPRLYVHKLFCFPFEDVDRQPEAVERLEHALSATMVTWPFINGYVIPAEDDAEHNTVKLCFNTPATGEIGPEVLIVKTIEVTEFPWTYQQLADAGMPLSAMNKDVFSSVPEWPNPGQTYPALSIQVNFIEGGLILCFAFHHAVADGTSFSTFLKAFASAIKNPTAADPIVEPAIPKRIAYHVAPDCDIPTLESFPEYYYANVPVRPAAYHRITTRILTFKATIVQKLEEAIREQLKKNTGSTTWVSNIACLSSLIWVAVVRARRARLDPAETTKIGIAVNCRSVMKPPLPEEYFGNCIVHTNATAKVSDFLFNQTPNKDDTKCPITIATLALGALRMRQAVQGVDSAYVSERLKMFSAMADPTETSRAYNRAMDTSNTGLDFSSWRDQGADLEFDIPGAGTSTVAWWRKAWTPNEGAYNILPRKGGSKGPADWEVSLGLNVEDMEKVCSAGELGGWVSRVVE